MPSDSFLHERNDFKAPTSSRTLLRHRREEKMELRLQTLWSSVQDVRSSRHAFCPSSGVIYALMNRQCCFGP